MKLELIDSIIAYIGWLSSVSVYADANATAGTGWCVCNI